ncbi:hypothetical protein G7Z17_g5360 [Cylindrodendrum hubeiense]|uniref:BZIP domain-containing protein n=1 Tax=Cylindrodendrum hubeiense TaxID=595255 RepID=A0A9P5HEA5_9HYPO|nr:hypothetical protein G7Z17_g5360 [Cylindrodendrum hubeiense]
MVNDSNNCGESSYDGSGHGSRATGSNAKRKPTSEARKHQNRISSHNYRQRRRQKLALLDDLLDASTSDAQLALASSIPKAQPNTVSSAFDSDGIGLLPVTGGNMSLGNTDSSVFGVDWNQVGTMLVPNMFSQGAGPTDLTPVVSGVEMGSGLVAHASITPLNHVGTHSSNNLTSVSSMFPATTSPISSIIGNIGLGDFDPPGQSSELLLDTQGGQTASIDTGHMRTQQDSMSQIVRSLSSLSLLEKRELIKVLKSEVDSEPEPEPGLWASFSYTSSSTSFTVQPNNNNATEARFESGRSLIIHMEVTRYERWLRHRNFAHPHLPDPQMNTIHVLHSSFYAAILANSAAIRLLNQEVLKEEGLSPYSIDHETGYKKDELLVARARFDVFIPLDLRPTDSQLLQPHHPYLDVIPFATFRQRAVSALATDPPLFDEYEMCADMDGEGLICWGGGGRDVGKATRQQEGNVGMISEVPWDARSWEPKVWFLRKYWFLVGGWDEEMWRSARWWAAMRNEQISFM